MAFHSSPSVCPSLSSPVLFSGTFFSLKHGQQGWEQVNLRVGLCLALPFTDDEIHIKWISSSTLSIETSKTTNFFATLTSTVSSSSVFHDTHQKMLVHLRQWTMRNQWTSLRSADCHFERHQMRSDWWLWRQRWAKFSVAHAHYSRWDIVFLKTICREMIAGISRRSIKTGSQYEWILCVVIKVRPINIVLLSHTHTYTQSLIDLRFCGQWHEFKSVLNFETAQFFFKTVISLRRWHLESIPGHTRLLIREN